MKRLFFFLFLFYCLPAHSQFKNVPPLPLDHPAMDSYLKNKKSAILTIKILHAPDSILKVPVNCTFVRFGSTLQLEKYYQFNNNGFLKITLEDRIPYQQIWLDIDHYLYAGLYVNDGLNVTIDASKIKTKEGFYMIDDGVEYSGADGELNKVMNKHVVYKKDLRDALGRRFLELRSTKRKYGDRDFLSKSDSVYHALNAINNEFLAYYPKFQWAIQNKQMADYFGGLCVAYWFDKMPDSIFSKINSFSPYFSSNEGVLFYNYLFQYLIYKKDNPIFNIDEQLQSNYSNYNSEQKAVLDTLKYYSQLPDSIKNAAIKGISKKKQDLFRTEIVRMNVQHLLQSIDSLYEPPKSDILKTFLFDIGKNAFSQTYTEIIKTMQTGWFKMIGKAELKQATITQKKVDNLLAKGTEVKGSNWFIGKPLESLTFNANLYRLDSIKNLDEFIINLKSKFINKALIIDFWATWCAPCLKELPASKKLQVTNRDLPIAFIYICTNSGSNITLWKNKIAQLQIPGTHIFADDKLVSELQTKFNTGSGFPAYVVIDSNGKLKPKAIEWIVDLDREKLKNVVGL